MGGGTHADLGVLEQLAQRLRQAGDALDGVISAAPPAPDAGDVSALMGAVVAHLCGTAGDLVTGLREAGTQVAESRATYARQDAAVGHGFGDPS